MSIDEIPYFSDLPQDTREFLARILLVILVFLLIWLMRRLLAWVVIRPLRSIVKKTGREIDDLIFEAVMLPIRYIIIATAILISAEILQAGDAADVAIRHFGRSVIIFGILLMVYRLVDIFTPSSNRLFAVTGITMDERLLPFVRTAIKLVVIAIGIVIILQEWGYDVSGVVAGIGLGGLAFSLAAQDTIANLFGFTAIVSDRPFDVGEYIQTPDVEGIVEHVGLRSTQVRRLDQSIVYVPNSVVAKSAILNWSRLKKRRLDFVLGVTYDATSEQMRVLLHRIREFLQDQLTVEPESVVVYFINFGDSALEILIRAYIMLADWGEFTAEKERLSLGIMDIVRELGMTVAFPSRSIYIENLPEFMGGGHPPQPKPKLTAEEKALAKDMAETKPQRIEQDASIDGTAEQDMPDK